MAKRTKTQPSIVVDGKSYKIPKFLLDATDEEITRVIRKWNRDATDEALEHERTLDRNIER